MKLTREMPVGRGKCPPRVPLPQRGPWVVPVPQTCRPRRIKLNQADS